MSVLRREGIQGMAEQDYKTLYVWFTVQKDGKHKMITDYHGGIMGSFYEDIALKLVDRVIGIMSAGNPPVKPRFYLAAWTHAASLYDSETDSSPRRNDDLV
jgi:hypothetical protein